MTSKSGKNWKEMCKKVFSKDQELEREQQNFQKTYRLLVLGTSESGKTTMMKQMRILYGAGYSERDRIAFVSDIRLYIMDIMESIAKLAETSSADDLEWTDKIYSAMQVTKECSVKYRQNGSAISLTNDSDACPPELCTHPAVPVMPSIPMDSWIPEEFWDSTEIIWASNFIQRIFFRKVESDLPDNAKHFLDRIPSIRRLDYVPSEQDILRVRIRHSKSMETIFTVEDVRYNMFDVAGQRDQRGKWLQCFNNITAIFFVVGTSGYSAVLEDSREAANRLAESFHVFSMLWNSKWLTRKSVILFLNKMDQLRNKITSGQSRLEDFFPDFKTYSTPSYAVCGSSDEPEFVRAKYFIRNEVMKITSAANTQHVCYPHFTTAIDTENVRKVFDGCRDIIQRSQIQQGIPI